MTPLEQFNEEVLLKIDKNVDYDEAEIGCNWGVDELKQFITQTLAAHKELILKMVREKAPKITKFGHCEKPICDNCGGTWRVDECDCLGFNRGVKEFLNNLGTL